MNAVAPATLLEGRGFRADGAVEAHDRALKCRDRLVCPYDAWHEAEPGKGYDAKAAEWRAKLPQATTTQPAE